jgi:methyl coenzyme M reductase subunit D
VANLGRILRIDEKLLSGKSTSEIEEIIKSIMVKHYNNAYGSYKKNELTSYVFYDLSGNNTKFSLEELGLAKAKANTAKVSTKMDTQSV